MTSPRRKAGLAVGAAVSALSLVLTAAAAYASDHNVAPVRASSGAGQFAVGAGAARPFSVAATPDGASVFVGTTDGTSPRVVAFKAGAATGSFIVSGLLGTSTAKSGLSSSYGLRIDAAGRLWTADEASKTVSAFLQSDADFGDHAPQLTISGPNTTLDKPADVAFAPNGDVIVGDEGSSPGLRIFPKDRGGNIAPKTVIAISGAPTGVAVDSKGQIYVANAALDTIQVFAAGAGAGASPIRTIAGPNAALHTPIKLVIDSSDNLYVANRNNGGINGGSSVAVFAPGAHDDAPPVARITPPAVGDLTTLVNPTGLALDANRNIYVADPTSPNVVMKFAPLIPLAKPSAVRSLKISGSSTSTTRTVSWATPTSNGGTPITKYRVVVKKGTATLYDKTTTSRAYKLLRSKLKAGTNRVYVYAVNKVGSSPSVTKTFNVTK